MGSVIVVPSIRFECRNPDLIGNHGDHLTPPSYTTSGDTIGRVCSRDVAREIYDQLRRKFYRFNSVIPPRLKKNFPSFEP